LLFGRGCLHRSLLGPCAFLLKEKTKTLENKSYTYAKNEGTAKRNSANNDPNSSSNKQGKKEETASHGNKVKKRRRTHSAQKMEADSAAMVRFQRKLLAAPVRVLAFEEDNSAKFLYVGTYLIYFITIWYKLQISSQEWDHN
jgi:hypothetical protein